MEIAELQKVSCDIGQNGVITTSAHVLHDIVRKLPENAHRTREFCWQKIRN